MLENNTTQQGNAVAQRETAHAERDRMEVQGKGGPFVGAAAHMSGANIIEPEQLKV